MLSVSVGEVVARRTPLRTGGPCGAWVVAHDVEGVAEVVSDCRAADWKLTVVGACTRTVFRDGPIDGAVMRLGTGFCSLREDWTVGAAFPVAALVAAAARAGRAGIESFACSPGSVGASLLLDPGWDDVVAAVSVLRRGKAVEVDLDEARTKKPIVLEARLALRPEEPAAVEKRTRDTWVKQRPVPCGSWYEGGRRGALRTALRSVRLPLVRLRDVAIPDSAPELLVNLGGGTAADLSLLHKSALERVCAVQGDDFRSRVKWVG
jgi:UDP-N-acetylmuramate dehydrogenase